MEMLNSEFKHMRQPLPADATVPNTSTAARTMSVADLDICPAAFARERAEWNKLIYAGINNGAYRAGFAASQEVYERFCTGFFDTLAKIEERLSKQRYMVAPHITDVDIRLFQTLVRLHPIYQYHFRLNKKTIHEYPSVFNYLCELYALNGTGALVVDLPFCKHHYFYSHRNINPFGIIPLGPAVDYALQHNRHSLD
jgi:putative glutathione S-transferase